jgi:hypothetical protein
MFHLKKLKLFKCNQGLRGGVKNIPASKAYYVKDKIKKIGKYNDQ